MWNTKAMSYAVFQDWLRKEWYKNSSSFSFNLSHMTKAGNGIAVFIQKENDWMIEAVMITLNLDLRDTQMQFFIASLLTFPIICQYFRWYSPKSGRKSFELCDYLPQSCYDWVFVQNQTKISKFSWKYSKNSLTYLYICVFSWKDPSEWPNCGSWWHQSGWSYTKFCCNCS